MFLLRGVMSNGFDSSYGCLTTNSGNRRMSTSPTRLARSAGWFYMLNFAFAPGMIAARRFVHVDDAAATATNILAHTTLFNAGFAGNIIAVTGYLVVTALFYQLFKPVDKNVSLVAALMSATGCAILAVGCAFYLSPMTLLAGLHSTTGLGLAQTQTIALALFPNVRLLLQHEPRVLLIVLPADRQSYVQVHIHSTNLRCRNDARRLRLADFSLAAIRAYSFPVRPAPRNR